MSAFFEDQTSREEIYDWIKGYSSCFEIDLDNLAHILLEIRKHVGVPVMAVVKNNAYGHGRVRWSYQGWVVIFHVDTMASVEPLKVG